MEEQAFGDILAAIRHLEPNNAILAQDRTRGHWQRTNEYQCMAMPDGSIGAFPPNMKSTLYRGENDLYPACPPSIYRPRNDGEKDPEGKRIDGLVSLDRMRMIEFELVARQFPQVQFAIADRCNVDFAALAQHYELRTDLIDLTCDLPTACFFATHRRRPDGEWETLTTGFGRIRGCSLPALGMPDFDRAHLIGLQPFERPGRQCAFALRLDPDEDFADYGWSVRFQQDGQANALFYDIFVRVPQNNLFPREDIDMLAGQIAACGKLSRQSVKLYAERYGCPAAEALALAEGHGIQIVERPVCSITRQRRRTLERRYRGRPYGNVQLTSRLSYLPPG